MTYQGAEPTNAVAEDGHVVAYLFPRQGAVQTSDRARLASIDQISWLWPHTTSTESERALGPLARASVKAAELGTSAGMVGAALLALEETGWVARGLE